MILGVRTDWERTSHHTVTAEGRQGRQHTPPCPAPIPALPLRTSHTSTHTLTHHTHVNAYMMHTHTVIFNTTVNLHNIQIIKNKKKLWSVNCFSPISLTFFTIRLTCQVFIACLWTCPKLPNTRIIKLQSDISNISENMQLMMDTWMFWLRWLLQVWALLSASLSVN